MFFPNNNGWMKSLKKPTKHLTLAKERLLI